MINKILTLIKNVKNWYMVPIDKIIGGRNIVYRFRNGITMECRTKTPDINEAVVVISGIEYPESECIVAKSDESVKTVFDLGGNIGSFSVWFNSLNTNLNYRGYVFEPHSGNFNLLQDNLKRNDVKKFEAIQKAVAGVSGTLKFDVSGGEDAYKLNDSASDFIEVEAIKLSDFCRYKNISLIDIFKIDIEGGEYDILNKDLDFVESSIKTIMMEYHNLDDKNNLDYIINILSRSFDINVIHGHDKAGILVAKNKNI